ncbi:hypothetical protein [Paracidovorax avenae]|uniref:hypothetical protein n=1 Tax=Paracidovorax avenae TaxID=80867 RepID=UPI00128EBD8D|nr:hypothetical protein [Paracidovorax avenae]
MSLLHAEAPEEGAGSLYRWTEAAPEETGAASRLVPEAGIEPARFAARDFLTTSTFAANAQAVRGLEHAFTIAFRH